jgi:hypothetical protein
MSASEQRTAANRSNASASTGPVSFDGKAVASQNARRHGIFSAKLFLDEENPDEFADLVIDLQRTLKPDGTIELALLERIAITMWRQRRLVSAETASLTLKRLDAEVARAASATYGSGYRDDVKEEHLQPFDPVQVEWCEAVISEIDALDEISLKSLETSAPNVWRQLCEDADSDGETPEEQVEDCEDGATGYVMKLYAWCQSELRTAAERPKLLAFAEQVRQKRLVLPLDQLQLFARYQTTLDNQLYKSLKALREAQEWRLKTLDGATEPRPGLQDKAA